MNVEQIIKNHKIEQIHFCPTVNKKRKEKKRIDCPESAELIMRYKWKPSPYYISLNFMNTCKALRDTYNTDNFWNTMYADHYRYGKKYVRIPPDIKKLYREN